VEGNVEESDCFQSGKVASMSFNEYQQVFDRHLARLETATADPWHQARGDPWEDSVQWKATGAFTMYAASTQLVAASKKDVMVPRLLSLCQSIPTIFVIGELNRGKFESEKTLRNAGLLRTELSTAATAFHSGDVIFVPHCAHGMLYENPPTFWP